VQGNTKIHISVQTVAGLKSLLPIRRKSDRLSAATDIDRYGAYLRAYATRPLYARLVDGHTHAGLDRSRHRDAHADMRRFAS